MKKTGLMFILLSAIVIVRGQERVVSVDFESNSFRNNPTIPFDKPFIIQGEISSEIEYVEISIHNENSKIGRASCRERV